MTKTPFENPASILELRACRNGPKSACSDDGIGILQGSLEEASFGSRVASEEQRVHRAPDRRVELSAPSNRVLASIRQQDRRERPIDSFVVSPMGVNTRQL